MFNSRIITMRSSVVVLLLLALLLSVPAAISRATPDEKASDEKKEKKKTDIETICDKAGEHSDICLSTSHAANPGALDNVNADTVMHFLFSAALNKTKDEKTKRACVKHYEFALEQSHLVTEAIEAEKLDEMNKVLAKIEGAYKKCSKTPPEIPKLLAAVKALAKEFLPAKPGKSDFAPLPLGALDDNPITDTPAPAAPKKILKPGDPFSLAAICSKTTVKHPCVAAAKKANKGPIKGTTNAAAVLKLEIKALNESIVKARNKAKKLTKDPEMDDYAKMKLLPQCVKEYESSGFVGVSELSKAVEKKDYMGMVNAHNKIHQMSSFCDDEVFNQANAKSPMEEEDQVIRDEGMACSGIIQKFYDVYYKVPGPVSSDAQAEAK